MAHSQDGGFQYWVTFIDDCTRWLENYAIRQKSGVFSAFKEFRVLVETQTGRKIKCLHVDQGGEYTLKEFLLFCKNEGIRVEFTTRATPQQNGVVECVNCTIEEALTSMLIEAGLPASFWDDALNVYRHVHNRCPTSALPTDMTPFQAFKGHKPRCGHLCVFGCCAYVLIGRDKCSSLQGHTIRGIFVGYPDGFSGWKVYDPITRKMHISRDVIFNEFEFPGLQHLPPASLTAVPTPTNFDLQPDFEPYDDDIPASVGAAPANTDNAPVIPVPEAVGAGAAAIPAPEAVGAEEIPVEPARAQQGRPPGPRQPAPPPTHHST